MNWAGKIIGLITGLLIGGPVGGLIGVFVGHLFDQEGFRRRWGTIFTSSPRPQTKGAFFNAAFQIMGYVAKSDGRVSEREIQQAKKVMEQMRLDDSLKRDAIRLFTEGKQKNFNLSKALLQIKIASRFQPMLLRSFLEMQIEMARADSLNLSGGKRAALQNIARELGVEFDLSDFSSDEGFASQGSYQEDAFSQGSYGYSGHEREYSRPRKDLGVSLEEAYATLGVSSSSNKAAIKQAYRRLMSQNHPDKLIARGESTERIKQATQKTQKIKQAYERIQKALAA